MILLGGVSEVSSVKVGEERVLIFSLKMLSAADVEMGGSMGKERDKVVETLSKRTELLFASVSIEAGASKVGRELFSDDDSATCAAMSLFILRRILDNIVW